MKNTEQFHKCIEAIKQDIATNFDGYRMNADIAKNAVENFDIDTIKVVLANSIQRKNHDGRITSDNKNWAKDIDVPIEENQRHYYILDGNAGLLNIVANQFRKLEKELQKPSALDQLSALKADTEPKPKITKPKDKEVR